MSLIKSHEDLRKRIYAFMNQLLGCLLYEHLEFICSELSRLTMGLLGELGFSYSKGNFLL